MSKIKKTNVMRILDQHKVNYQQHTYDPQIVDGIGVAIALQQDSKQVFKTLVTVAKSKEHYVFVIPVDKELNLKKAAEAVSEKAVTMIKQKELLPLTGYIHGGCSPIGMKKQFKTIIDEHALKITTIIFSAGKIGYQVECDLISLAKVLEFQLKDVVD